MTKMYKKIKSLHKANKSSKKICLEKLEFYKKIV